MECNYLLNAYKNRFVVHYSGLNRCFLKSLTRQIFEAAIPPATWVHLAGILWEMMVVSDTSEKIIEAVKEHAYELCAFLNLLNILLWSFLVSHPFCKTSINLKLILGPSSTPILNW